MLQTETPSLKDLFNDNDYAWQLLEGEVHLEVAHSVTSQDVSNLLQLYMKGVEKMNSYLDLREAFFKARVIRLMSRPSVMKTLDNNQQKNITSAPNIPERERERKDLIRSDKITSTKTLQSKPQFLQLKQKKMEIEVRLAYEVKENTPTILHNMFMEHKNKQDAITLKINKIVENHEEQLLKRIKERKQKGTSKSLFNILNKNNLAGASNKDLFANINNQKLPTKFEQAIESCIQFGINLERICQKERDRRLFKSWQPRKIKVYAEESEGFGKKGFSLNMGEESRNKNIKNKRPAIQMIFDLS